MSFSENIEYLMAHPGTVDALVTKTENADTAMRGHMSWRRVLGDAVCMLVGSGEDTISAVIGEHSILAETRDGQQCAVVYPTGHPVSKVMRRMLRKAAGPKRTMRKVEAKPVATPSE
jgi:hypothetical protein